MKITIIFLIMILSIGNCLAEDLNKEEFRKKLQGTWARDNGASCQPTKYTFTDNDSWGPNIEARRDTTDCPGAIETERAFFVLRDKVYDNTYQIDVYMHRNVGFDPLIFRKIIHIDEDGQLIWGNSPGIEDGAYPTQLDNETIFTKIEE